MAACKWRFSALPLLTYIKYAPLRFSKIAIFGSPWRVSGRALITLPAARHFAFRQG